jgi:hypothetical protein
MRAVVAMGGQLSLGQEVVHGALALVDPLLVVPAAPGDTSSSSGGGDGNTSIATASSSSSAERLAALVGVGAGPCQEQLLAGLLLQVRWWRWWEFRRVCRDRTLPFCAAYQHWPGTLSVLWLTSYLLMTSWGHA